jgi:hypothetical protein
MNLKKMVIERISHAMRSTGYPAGQINREENRIGY